MVIELITISSMEFVCVVDLPQTGSSLPDSLFAVGVMQNFAAQIELASGHKAVS
jgi:hypothetical protein